MTARPMTETTTIYLIRHAATPSNEQRPRILQGSSVNTSLSERRFRQAKRVGEFLSTVKFDAILSSPLLRAKETAAEIASPHSLQTQDVPGLEEVNVGRWERLDWKTIEQDFSEDYRRFMEDPVKNGYLGGESYGQVQERVVPVFKTVARKHSGQQIAVVAHTVVNRTLLGTFLGMDLAEAQNLAQENCSINILKVRDGLVSVETMNSAFHMRDVE